MVVVVVVVERGLRRVCLGCVVMRWLEAVVAGSESLVFGGDVRIEGEVWWW